MFENPFYDAMAAAVAQHQQNCPEAGVAANRRITFSARKLAATLWELQETPFLRNPVVADHKVREPPPLQPPEKQSEKPPQLLRTLNGKRNGAQSAHPSSPASSRVSQRSMRRAPIQYKFGDNARRNPPASGQTPSAHSQVLRLLERRVGARTGKSSNGDPREIEADEKAITPSSSFLNLKAIPGSTGPGPTTSSDLLKVLSQIWNLEEQHNSSLSMVSALRADLERARARVQELTLEEKSHRKDLETLTKQLADEKLLWQEREKEAIRAAIQPLKEELEDERKSKRKLELLYKKVAKELSDAKKSLGEALQEFEREQKARELMEDVCDELAREIGEDRAQVEKLKRESAKVREEVEEERKMLQMAEVWREERVQMKLAEARLELEEKNTALDRLRSELEAFLKAKRAMDAREDGSRFKEAKASDLRRTSGDLSQARPSSLYVSDLDNFKEGCVPSKSPADVADSSGARDTYNLPNQELVDDDDLHSFELNKESFFPDAKSTQWGYKNVHQQETESTVVRSMKKGSSPLQRMSKGKQGQGNRQGLERTRSNPVEAMMVSGETREPSGKWDYQPESNWIDRSIERGELRGVNGDRRSLIEAREGLHSPWQSDNEESQGHITMATGTTRENSDMQANGSAWTLQSVGSSRDQKSASGFSPVQQSASFTSSPTRKWSGQYWSSPDPGSPRPSRVPKASDNMPKVGRDNSLKAKLLEAKLEGQQARLRNSGKGL